MDHLNCEMYSISLFIPPVEKCQKQHKKAKLYLTILRHFKRVLEAAYQRDGQLNQVGDVGEYGVHLLRRRAVKNQNLLLENLEKSISL